MRRHLKLCHTSDWHLGHTLHGHGREHEHARFLEFLLETLVREEVDSLIVAGDVFDGANPPASAQAMFYDFLARARTRLPGLDVLVIAGNHDSPARLAAPDPILRALGVRVVGSLPRAGSHGRAAIDADAVAVPLHDRGGEVAAWVAAIPFLRTSDLLEPATDPVAIAEGTRAVVREAIDAARVRVKGGQALLATGHCHLRDAQASAESERVIAKEGLDADLFDDDVAYVALGHLHFPQHIGRDHVRYSGSPIPLAMSEESYPHEVRIVRFEGARLAAQHAVRIPRTVDVLRIPREGPAELDTVLAQLERLEVPADLPRERQPFLEVRVRTSEPVPDLRARIEAALAGRAVRLVKIAHERAGEKLALAEREPRRQLSDLTALEVFRRAYAKSFEGEPSEALLAAFEEVVRDAEHSR